MTRKGRRTGRAGPLAWIAALFLVIAALVPPVAGPAVGADAPVAAMAKGANAPHGMDCCPEGGHAAGAVCAACLLAVAATPVVAPAPVSAGLRLGLPPATLAVNMPEEVPHGPPRLV